MLDRRLETLFRRFQERGDVAALGRVFDQTAPELLHVAAFLCADRATAEDVLQATFQTAIEKRERYDPAERLRPWLLGILARHAHKARAAAARAPNPERLAPREPADPAETAANGELHRLVEQGVAALPGPYSSAVRSYLEHGQSPREIGQSLGISSNAASVRLHRGLKLLRRALPKSVALGSAAAIGSTALARNGLARVRGAVLTQAARTVPGLAAPSLTAAATLATIGGLTMMKIAIASGAVVLAAGVTWWVARRDQQVEIARLQIEVADLQAALARAPAPRPVRAAEPSGLVAPRTAVAPAGGAAPERESASEPAARALTAQEWLQRFRAAPSWREALAIARELARLAPAESLAILREIYHDIPQAAYRINVLKPFVQEGLLTNAVDVLHLAATDPDPEVLGAAFQYLKSFAFQDFNLDREAYLLWYQRYHDRPLDEVLRSNASDFVRRLNVLSGTELAAAVAVMERMDLRIGSGAGIDLKQLLREAGLLATVARWIVPHGDPELMATGLRWIAELGPTESQLRHMALPVVEAPELYGPEAVSAAWSALGQKGQNWAVEPILDAMHRIPVSDGAYYGAASALGAIGDPRAIPTMIGMIVAEDGYATRYGVGYFGLRHLTGVEYSEDHDAAFWLEWWEKNRAFLPPEVQGASIPKVTLPH